MNTIVWSDLAFLSYTDVVNYLTENYSLDAAIGFDEEVERLLGSLRSFKSIIAHLMNGVRLCGNVW